MINAIYTVKPDLTELAVTCYKRLV